LHNPSQTNGDNLNNVRCEISRTSREKNEGISEGKKLMNFKQTGQKYQRLRGINEFKVYQPGINIVKDENGDLLADSHNILNRWKNCFC
jgi:hypothetical protein